MLAAPATGGYFSDDQAAITAGAVRDGLAYPGRRALPAEAVSVLLVLSDGHVAHGDCVSVQYSGAGGREPRLDPAELAARLGARPRRGCAAAGGRVPRAARCRRARRRGGHGLSQALLDARRTAPHDDGGGRARRVGAGRAVARVPVFAQTGEDRRGNVDKMILKRVTRSRTG